MTLHISAVLSARALHANEGAVDDVVKCFWSGRTMGKEVLFSFVVLSQYPRWHTNYRWGFFSQSEHGRVFSRGESWATWLKLGCWDSTATRAVVACEPYTHHRLLCSLSGAMTFPQSYYFSSLRSPHFFRCFSTSNYKLRYMSKASFSPPHNRLLIHPSRYQKSATYLICNRNFQLFLLPKRYSFPLHPPPVDR